MEEHIYSECYDDVLMEQLTLFYAQAVKNLLFKVSRKLCYGCQERHLSQTRHSCIGYILLNIHEYSPRLFRGEHLLCIRDKMTSPVNNRLLISAVKGLF